MSATRARLGVVFLTVLIDLIGFGLVIPVLPYYAQSFGVAGLGFGALIGIYSLMQFVATVVLGRLSDRVGRRPILLVSIVFSFTGYLVFALAGSYTVLFLGRIISGFSAGNISVAQAYIADITPPKERSRGMGLVGAAFGLGYIVGPALGGLAGHFGGPMAVGLTAAGLSGVNLVSAYFILQESLRPEHRVARPLFSVTHLVHAARDPVLGPPFLVFALIPFAFSGYMVALPLYARARFGWGEAQLGWFFTLIGVMATSVQGYFFGKLARRFGDRLLAIVGTIGMAVPIAMVPFVPGPAWLYAWVLVFGFANSLLSPAITGLISRLVGVAEQGATLGAAQSFSALGRFAGPFLFGELYDRLNPTVTFLGASLVMVGAWAATLRFPADLPHREPAPD
jgi:DHA1 family tetracycline resistance protein-like MFS transporter